MGLTPSHLTINGKTRLQGANTPMPGLKIELWDSSAYGCIAAATSDINGTFRFFIEDPVAAGIIAGTVSLHYHVYKGDILLLDVAGPSDYTAFVNLDISPAVFDEKVPDNTLDESPGKYISISGSFTDAAGITAEGVKINIYESALRDKILLTSAITDINGRYNVKVVTRNIGSSPAPVKRSIRVEAVTESGDVLATSGDIFDWPEELQADLKAFMSDYKAQAEFDTLHDAVFSIDESLSISSLISNADDGIDEIKYVAGATDRHHKIIETLVYAHKYGEEASLSPELLYALCKTNGTERNPLIGMKEAEIRSSLANAVAKNAIKEQSAGAVDAFVEAAKTFQVTATLGIHVKNEDVTIGDLMNNIFSSGGDVTDFLGKYIEREYASVPEFWAAYEAAHGTEKSEQAQRGLKLIAITGSQPEMVGRMMDVTSSDYSDPSPDAFSNSFYRIASMSEDDWYSHIDAVSVGGKICVPASVRATVESEDRTEIIRAYAKKLKAVAQDFFPLAALHGKIEDYEGQHLIDDEDVRTQVRSFIANNPSFDVRTESVHDINAEDYNLLGITDVEAVKEGLVPFQRLLRVTGGKPEAVAAMKAGNIDSAEAIMQMSQDAFTTAYGDMLGGDVSAGMAYAKASAIAAITTNAITNATQQMTDPGLAVLPGFALNDLTDPEAQPDLATLFGSMDYCSCQECLSLYSPAAYMTDMLSFLRTKVPAAYTELIRRRPDLKYIDLTCKNTNTTLPYVDLVNELLELVILNQKMIPAVPLSFQTTGNAGDLGAYPEHVQRNTSTLTYEDYYGYHSIYDTYLPAEVYPYENPFSLAAEETRTYLQHLGMSRMDAMSLFKPANQATVSNTVSAPAGEITDYTIYAEYLGLTTRALDIITDNAGTTPWLYYGLPAGNVSTMIDPSDSGALLPAADWDVLLTGRLDVLLQQAKISYTELLELLNTDFLNKEAAGVRNIGVSATAGSPNDTCITSKLRLVFTSPETPAGFLKKLHRMIRLVRTGKLSAYQWDTLFRTLGITDLTREEMQVVGCILIMAENLKIKPELLACWWSNIDAHQYTNYKTDTLSKLDSVYDTVFRSKQLGSGPAVPFPEAADISSLGTYKENTAALASLCRMREEELLMLLNAWLVEPGDPVDLTVLSRLYVMSLLAKSFKYSIAELLQLLGMSVLSVDMTNPSGLSAIAASIGNLSALQQMAGMVKSVPFRMDELNYLLFNYDPKDRVDPNRKDIQHFYEGLRKELQKFPLFQPANPLSLTGDEEAQLRKLGNVILQQFSKEFNCSSEQVQALFQWDGSSYIAPVSWLVEPAFVSSSYDLSQENCLTLAGSSTPPVLPSFDLIGLYNWYRILYKAVFIAGKLKIKTAELNYIITAGSTPLGFSFTDLPYEVDSNGLVQLTAFPLSYTKAFFTMAAWIAVCRKLNLNDEEFAAMVDAADTQDRATVTAMLSRDIDNKDAVPLLIGVASVAQDGGFLKLDTGTDYVPSVYENVKRFLDIIDMVSFCQRTGLNPDSLHATLCPGVVLADSRKILLAAKGKYSDAEWAGIAKPLRDVLRRKQRAAMVGYVLAHPDASSHMRWLTENDLFAYLLIDVDMDSCMVTSRIRQAISSIQLFMDRMLMGLEYVAGSSTVISMAEDQAEQWETWRKWYRIWEANRKIFLYPENWIEPELRDDKSVFFGELETALQQDDLTPERAQDAIYDYLLKLDETARMEPVGIADNFDDVTKKTTTHVFARTYSEPQHYFYRRLQDDEWTPWERVDIDIKSEHVAPVIWNNRLYLFWLTFKEKKVQVEFPGWIPPIADNWFYSYPKAYSADSEQTDDSSQVKVRQYEISLNWTEYKNGKWLKHKIAKDKAVLKTNFNAEITMKGILGDPATYTLQQPVYSFLTDSSEMELGDFIKSRFFMAPHISAENKLYLMLMFPDKLWGAGDDNMYIDGFVFEDPGREPEVWRTQEAAQSDIYTSNLRAPNGTRNRNMRFLQLPFDGNDKLQLDHFGTWASDVYLYRKDVTVSSANYVSHNWQEDILAQMPSGNYKLVIQSGFSRKPLENKFFFEDSRNTFFVRKMSTDKHLATPIIKSNEVNLSIAGYAASYNYEDAGNVGSHIDTGVPFTAYDDSTPVAGPVAIPAYYFQTFYHPHMRAFIKTFNSDGIEKMLQIGMQVQTDDMHFQSSYLPTNLVHPDYPVDKVDFDYFGAYSGYNWELFFHVPMLIAQRLSNNQQFEEARKWYHYIFDPTSNSGPAGMPAGSKQRFWKFRPFYEAAGQPVQSLNDLLILISYNNAAARAQVQKWEDNPFKPHVIARMRILAYMKNVVMKYIDNLIAWGDQLFRRDTIESINEATQLYMLAANILGKKPTEVRRRSQTSPKSFDDISGTLDEFSNARVYIESYIDVNVNGNTGGLSVHHAPQMFYFCLTRNDKLMGYWDTVADRLFKIRNCMNIDGQVRQLPLFEPPIDPALLVRAAAAGLDINSVLNDLTSAPSHYRFSYVLAKANEFCGDVKALGNALLAALEKKDAEHLALLRSGQEISLLEKIKLVKQAQIEEANANLEALEQTREITQARYEYYSSREFMNDKEKEAMKMLQASAVQQTAASEISFLSSILSAIPNFNTQGLASGFTLGGGNLGPAMQAISTKLGINAAIMQHQGSTAATMAGYQRRMDDWQFQAATAQQELVQIDKQIVAAEIRVAIAEKDLDNHELQIDNARETDEYMRSKFTNEQLYSWMVAQLSATYFQAYQLAYDMAKKAERCYLYELPLSVKSTDGFIKFGYWDSLKKGLLAGEKLQYDLHKMEAAYMEDNQRELELAKHISLAMTDPKQILKLRESGSCDIYLPEELFDLDYPGHYLRRIKSVSISVPGVAGPYTTISAKLTLVDSKYRKKTDVGGGYAEDNVNPDFRFIYMNYAEDFIATSTAQNDSGLFELNFRDERYLPFEGRGAVSHWQLELADENQLRLFDFDTINDVILHLRYTARDGGALKTSAIGHINSLLPAAANDENGLQLPRYFSLKHEFAGEWNAYAQKVAAGVSGAKLEFTINPGMFPAFCKGRRISIGNWYLKLQPGTVTSVTVDDSANEISVTINSTTDGNVATSGLDVNAEGLPLSLSLTASGDTVSTAAIGDIFLVAYYTLSV